MSEKLYAVIDTNVIVSALISKNEESSPVKVLNRVFLGDIVPVWDDEIIKEYREVLSREKFHLNPLDIEDALTVIIQYGLRADRTPVPNESFPDPSDIVFYEVKMSREDAYLVTGNIRHYPDRPFVVTPREMAEIVEGLPAEIAKN